MPNLLDITPSVKTVDASIGKIEVPGLSIIAIVDILKGHPQILAMFTEGEFDLDMGIITSLGVEVSLEFFAAGLGYPNNPEAIERCKTFTPGDALLIGTAIIEQTFPQGPKSFLESIQNGMKSMGVNVDLQTPSLTNSQLPVNP